MTLTVCGQACRLSHDTRSCVSAVLSRTSGTSCLRIAWESNVLRDDQNIAGIYAPRTQCVYWTRKHQHRGPSLPNGCPIGQKNWNILDVAVSKLTQACRGLQEVFSMRTSREWCEGKEPYLAESAGKADAPEPLGANRGKATQSNPVLSDALTPSNSKATASNVA